ncbi:hypothetical protein INR49_001971 [Caranx melampygus]|nr:hypothetical protein INR49_001971 [Caranx melampygus]
MQRIASFAARREFGGLAACRPGVCALSSGPSCSRQPVEHRQWAAVCLRPARPYSGEAGAQCRRFCRRRFVFMGQRHRLFCSQPGADKPAGSSGPQPDISVVGIPDPITWIRCKVTMLLIELYFELDVNSEEFHRGVKQALVHVSNVMSRGTYHELRGILSNEMVEYVEKRCRKFCFIVMRFWLLSTHEGPDDPEGTKIFKVAYSEDGTPQKKIATAVYEFHRELTRGASPEWKVTTVWHWHWKLAE